MCLRFEVKQYGHNPGAVNKDYVWYEMGFFGHWGQQGKLVLLCLNTPLLLRDYLHRAVMSPASPITIDIHWLSSLVLSQIVHLYDHSVWTLRNVIRKIEEVSAFMQSSAGIDTNASNQSRNKDMLDQPNFPFLHDVARHVIHSTETLDVAINTLSNMAEMISLADFAISNTSQRIQQDLAFHKQVLRNLHARSSALDARLRNEINLVDWLISV